MLKAICVRVEYEAGERLTCQGVKGHRAGKHVGGHFFQNAGYGVGQYFISSKLLLYVQFSDAKEHVLRIDRIFKKKIGMLTEKRRELISRTMPKEIQVKKIKEEHLCSDPEMSFDERTVQYKPLTKELEDWLFRVQELMANPKELRNVGKAIKQRKDDQRKAAEKAEKQAFKEYCRAAKRARAEEKAKLEERRQNALKLCFVKGYNPKYGSEQWEARYGGRLYVLRREDDYELEEKHVPVEKIFDLVPSRIVLVQRI